MKTNSSFAFYKNTLADSVRFNNLSQNDEIKDHPNLNPKTFFFSLYSNLKETKNLLTIEDLIFIKKQLNETDSLNIPPDFLHIFLHSLPFPLLPELYRKTFSIIDHIMFSQELDNPQALIFFRLHYLETIDISDWANIDRHARLHISNILSYIYLTITEVQDKTSTLFCSEIYKQPEYHHLVTECCSVTSDDFYHCFYNWYIPPVFQWFLNSSSPNSPAFLENGYSLDVIICTINYFVPFMNDNDLIFYIKRILLVDFYHGDAKVKCASIQGIHTVFSIKYDIMFDALSHERDLIQKLTYYAIMYDNSHNSTSESLNNLALDTLNWCIITPTEKTSIPKKLTPEIADPISNIIINVFEAQESNAKFQRNIIHLFHSALINPSYIEISKEKILEIIEKIVSYFPEMNIQAKEETANAIGAFLVNYEDPKRFSFIRNNEFLLFFCKLFDISIEKCYPFLVYLYSFYNKDPSFFQLIKDEFLEAIQLWSDDIETIPDPQQENAITFIFKFFTKELS